MFWVKMYQNSVKMIKKRNFCLLCLICVLHFWVTVHKPAMQLATICMLKEKLWFCQTIPCNYKLECWLQWTSSMVACWWWRAGNHDLKKERVSKGVGLKRWNWIAETETESGNWNGDKTLKSWNGDKTLKWG
jgi:hypothetical protein